MSDSEKMDKAPQDRSDDVRRPTGDSTGSFVPESATIWGTPHPSRMTRETSAVPQQELDATIDAGHAKGTRDRLAGLWQQGDGDGNPSQTIRGSRSMRFETASATVHAKRRLLTRPGQPRQEDCDYEFTEVLGEGGMGTVYLARQTSVDRDIAVKVIRSRYAREKSQCGKFLTEAIVTGDLEHPNIVPVYDVGADDNGHPFYAMKRVKGTPWSQVIGKMTVKENLAVLMRVCDAVAFAHARNVIHRDLKPANVMLGEFGEVLVMDWGLAVAVDEHSKAAPLTDNSAMAGTPAYMSPEMANGEIERISTRSDVYLLGGILFEIVAGKQPHEGKKVMDCLVNAALNSIPETDAEGELTDIALKAMAGDTAERYASVQEFQAAIRDYESHAQSIGLCERARARFEQAQRTREYDDFVQALFGYRQALELWGGNIEAGGAIAEVSLQYARCAYDKNDLDLAASLLDPEHPRHHRMHAKVLEAQREREARRRRYAFYRRTVTSLAAIIMIILTIGFVMIRAEKQRAVQAERSARVAQAKAESEREKADIARRAEVKQRRIADAATARAKEEEAKAVDALEKMKEAVRAMMEARSLEEEARARAKTAELMAADAQDKLAKSGLLLDNSWWTFDARQARHEQERAARRIGYGPDQTVELPDNRRMAFALIPSGSFVMGSPAKEKLRGGEEYLHRVVISRPFYMGRHEVTVGQWRAITGSLPPNNQEGTERDPTWPVMEVSWNDIETTFIPAARRFAPEGFTLRLPTEAEWEYACRAGTGSAFNTGEDESALAESGWYLSNSGRDVRPVGGRAPNQWGLYDMHGNVAEWCLDAYNPRFYLLAGANDPLNDQEADKRIIRGGGCINLPEHCRSAYRSWANADNRYRFLGFRLVLIAREGPQLIESGAADTDREALAVPDGGLE